jgi:hypothetical protein
MQVRDACGRAGEVRGVLVMVLRRIWWILMAAV